MVSDYREYDGFKVFKLGKIDPEKKNYLLPDDVFISNLSSLGYTILYRDAGDPIIISKNHDIHGAVCVIYHKDRIYFRTNNIKLLKIVYVFVTLCSPTLDDYDKFLSNTNLPFITKTSFLEKLKSETFNVTEKPNNTSNTVKIEVFADLYESSKLSRVSYIYANDVAKFEMFVYDHDLLMFLFQYCLTPLEKR